MSIVTSNFRTLGELSARGHQAGGWSALLVPLLAAAGALTVIVGSYATWATFYAGLIARDGVSGHGKYFIALAVAGALSVALAQIRGVWPGLRFAATAVGIAIAFFAVRDLRNLEALLTDPAAAFYVPGRGDGLFIVIVGAVVLALSPFARGVTAASAVRLLPTALAAMSVASVGLLVAGLYGEYYLHLSNGHARGHTDTFTTAHLLTAGGTVLLASVAHLTLVRALAGRR